MKTPVRPCRQLLLAASASLLPFISAPAHAEGNVSNLTLIDTQNPDLEVLAATISPAERDAIFWQLNPRNRRGVFMSKGPKDFAGGSSGPAGFLTLPRTSGGNWQVSHLTHSEPPLFLFNRGAYTEMPWANPNTPPWYYSTIYGNGFFWNPNSSGIPLSEFRSAIGDAAGPLELSTDLYKRLEFPTNFTFPLGPATTWQNNYRQLDTSATKLVIVIHGWQPDAPSDPYAESDMAVLLENLHDSMTKHKNAVPGWDLFAYNWAQDAATGPRLLGRGSHSSGGTGLGVENGVQAAEIGYLHGLALGHSLRQLFVQDLEKVHFIAHSAGAWVAHGASKYLASTSTSRVIEQQVTLLDPFNPVAGRELWNTNSVIHSAGGGMTDELPSILGSNQISNWHIGYQGFTRFENIYAHTLVVPGTYERYWGGATTGATTSGQIPYSNLKVAQSELILGAKLFTYDTFDGWAWTGHGGPIRYYAYTINPNDFRTWAFLNTSKSKKEKTSGSSYRDLAGWDHSMFAQEYAAWKAQQPSLPGWPEMQYIQFKSVAGTIPMTNQMSDDGIIAFDTGITYTIGVNVNNGWITVFMLPHGGGPAIVAGPSLLLEDGSFEALDGSGNVIAGQFDLSQSPPPLSLSLNGATVSGSFDKVTGASAFAGIGAALDGAEETVVITMVLSDGTALAAASGFDILGQNWQASATGTVDGAGTLSATSDDGFSVQTVVGEGGEASTPSSFSAPAGVILPEPLGFSAWMGLYPTVPADRRGMMDDAGSGVANVVAFFQGIDPVRGVLDVGLQDLFRQDASTTIAGFWRNRMAEGVEGRVCWSRDLASWRDGGESDGVVTVDLVEEVLWVFGGREWVQVSATANGAVPESLFLRIEVEVPGQPPITEPIFTESFGTLANGTPVTTSNSDLTYVRVGTQGGSIVAQNPSSFDEGSSLVINGPSGGSLNGIGVGSGLQLQSTLDIDFSFDYKLLNTSGQIVIGLGSGTSFTGNGIFSTGQGLFWLQINGTTIQRRTTSGWADVGTTVAPNTPGRLRIAVDRVAETMDLYLNGQLAAASLPLTTPSVEADGFRIYAVNGSSVELDNIEVGAFYLPAHDGTAGVNGKPVQVYIMAGDSAMVGFGTIAGTSQGTLETLTFQNGKFHYLLDSGGSWMPRNDVHYHGLVPATGKAPLAPGLGSSASYFGPELAFGHVMGWHHDEPVLIIKTSTGNRSMGWDFLPPTSSRWDVADRTYAAYGESPQSWLTASGGPAPGSWYAGKSFDDFFLHEPDMGMLPWASGIAYPGSCAVKHNGFAYISKSAHTSSTVNAPEVDSGGNPVASSTWNVYSLTNVVDILDNFAAEHPQWIGRDFEIAGYVWWQGDRDRFTDAYAQRYALHMMNFIKQLRSYYANRYPAQTKPDAPFVLGTIGYDGWSLSGNGLTIANGQLAVSGNSGTYPEFSGNVKTMETRGYWRDSSQSPSTQSFLYNHNAETFMLTGEALGRAMIHLKSGD